MLFSHSVSSASTSRDWGSGWRLSIFATIQYDKCVQRLRLDKFSTDAMKKHYWLIGVAIVTLLSSGIAGQPGKSAKKSDAKPCDIQEPIHEDIAAQLSKFKPVKMPFNESGLNGKERQM